MPSELLTGTAHTLTLRNLQNGLAPGFLATATVTATVYNAATDVAILGQTWPITLDYVLQSQGVYRATLEEDLQVTPGQRIYVLVTADAGSGVKRTWRLDMMVVAG